jgi:uncharacterized membrane protein
MPEQITREGAFRDVLPSGAYCYLYGVLFPLLYLLSRRRIQQNPFLRFHCFQCLLLFAVWIPLLFSRPQSVWLRELTAIASVLCTVGWLTCLIQAGRRKRFHLPVIGPVAERLAGK